MDQDKVYNTDPSYSKGIHTIVIAYVCSWTWDHPVLALVTELSAIILGIAD